ncbi:hypothetical protein [Streptomyces sp. NRRL F-5630]|uniref:hypothetical protein n=1 Tax=unclassified Streptomyces TaxID=2593676 RepID=UPI00068CE809|nr:hypothetical protein [Streptomyces sp. NRRL F-5630]
MKISTAVLIAGTAVSAAVATAVIAGIAGVHQEKRRHGDRIEISSARVQKDWLTQVATNQDLAKLWALDDLSAEDYMGLMHANRQLCDLGLLDRLGLVTDEQRDLHSSVLMENRVVRLLGPIRPSPDRGSRCAGDKRAMARTALLDRAARDYPAAA